MIALSLRLRFRAGIAECFLPHLRDVLFPQVHDLAAGAGVVLLLERAFVKIVDQRRAVMFLNDVDDPPIQAVLEREVDAFLHMRDDDERAHRRREIVMRVALEVHVLGVVIRLHQFADVVKIGADAAKRGVGADRFRGGFGEIRDDQAVMIGARRLDRHAPQERMIEIGRFEPRDVGRDLKQVFEDRQDAAHDRGGQDAVADGEGALNSDHFPVVRARRKEIDRTDDAEGERQEPDGHANAEARPESDGSAGELAG